MHGRLSLTCLTLFCFSFALRQPLLDLGHELQHLDSLLRHGVEVRRDDQVLPLPLPARGPYQNATPLVRPPRCSPTAALCAPQQPTDIRAAACHRLSGLAFATAGVPRVLLISARAHRLCARGPIRYHAGVVRRLGTVVCIGSLYTLSSIAAKQGSAPLDAYAAWPSDRYTHGMLHTWLLQDCSLASKLSRTFSRRRLRAIEMRRYRHTPREA